MRKLMAVLLLTGCVSSQPAAPPPAVQVPEPQFAPDVRARLEADLAAARRDYDANPKSADAIIWLGRRTAYLGRYGEAIEIFSNGIRLHPRDARLYRHRGHRFITVRQFGRAVSDLSKAAQLVRGKPDQIEPDGQPNARNIPLTSLQSNICYHLGLAYYLQGDFERALPVYRECAKDVTNADRLVSTSHWLYMTLRRLGRPEEAERVLDGITFGMDVIENVAYHKLLLMYRGDIAVEELAAEPLSGNDSPTVRYGIANWYFYNGDPPRAQALWEKIVAEDPWPAFGTIAAEAEVKRMAPATPGNR